MRIDSSGNVGIGTSSPTEQLDVQLNAIVNESGAGDKGLFVGPSGFAGSFVYKSSGDAEIAPRSGKNLLFAASTGGTERMRIDSSGNVGINQSNPTRKLHVTSAGSGVVATFGDSLANNTIEVTRTTTNASYIALTATSAVGGIIAGPTFTFSTCDSGGGSVTERMRLDSSGRLGLGTTNPLGNMQIVTATAGTVLNVNHNTGGTYPKASGIGLGATSTALTVSSDGSTVSFTGGAGLYAENTAASGNPTNLVFWTTATGSPAERMRIDSSGNLLVGTTTVNGTGITLGAGDYGYFSRSGDAALFVNRSTSDGNIIELRKADTEVGSIGTVGGHLAVGGGDVFLEFNSTSNALQPMSTVTGGASNGAVDLGASLRRFKDLYLSSAVKFGSQDALATDGTSNYVKSGSAIYFQPANTTKMLLDSSGNLLVGCTGISTDAPNVDGSLYTGGGNLKIRKGTSGFQWVQFYGTGVSSPIGSISNVSNTSTSYNTTSDERLKENIADANDAGAIVDAIQIRKFDWKVNGEHQRYGMVAQELQSVAPEAVTGDADSEDMMGVDYSKLVPMMLKEIQSLRARVAQLEGAN